MAQEAVEDGRFEEATHYLTEVHVCVFGCELRQYDRCIFLFYIYSAPSYANPVLQKLIVPKDRKIPRLGTRRE